MTNKKKKNGKKGGVKRSESKSDKQFAKSKKQKVRSEPAVVNDDEDVSIHSEDQEFVSSLSAAQVQAFLATDLENESKTPLDEARSAGLIPHDEDDEEEEEEEKIEVDAVRSLPRDWEAEERKQNMLPIKRKDGTVALPTLTAEDLEERRRLEERREARKKEQAAQEASGQSKKRKKLGDEVVANPVIAAPAAPPSKRALKEEEQAELKAFQERLDNIPNKQAEIESLCREILSNPEENMGEQARTLVGLCVDEDVVVKQLAMLSCAAVFADLMPGYRIREDNEERADNAVLSKDVKKLRRYERRLLHHYRGFAELLVQVLALRAPNPPLPDEAQQQRRFRVVSQRALHQMQLVAVKALARVLMANPSFNYADMLVKTLVRAADLTHIMDGAVSRIAVETIIRVFGQRNELEQISELVLEIGRYVRSRKFVANPEMLRTFLHLNISDAISDIDVNSNRVTRKEKHVSKREKKKHKFSKVVDSKIREGEAERRKSEVQRFQRQMAQSMFLTYFRVLKTASNSPLLPAVLEGVSRWCHLLNVDFMFEIVHALLKLLQQASLPLNSAMFCAITAFQALKNAGDVFRIDLSSYYHFVYPKLLQVPLVPEAGVSQDGGETLEEITIRCLQLMLASKTYRMANRSAAFAKRLATMAIHAVPGASIAFLQLCRRIIATDSRLEQLLDPEDVGTDVFSANVDDPDNANAMATSLFELILLKDHYHPHVAMFAQQMLSNAPLAPHDPKDYAYSYDWKVQIFNPPLEEPGPSRLDKKLRKLAKYDEKKRAKFSASLIPQPPERNSPFAEKMLADASKWIDEIKSGLF